MILLNSENLRVEIASPGEAPNDTCRFDRAGFVTEIILDGRHRFCASEPNNLPHPCSGGRGLCSEIKCDLSAEAGVGEWFPKFGIGLFRKPDEEAYIFYRHYEHKPFLIDVEQTENCVQFTTRPEMCMGYALAQKKTISVDKNVLTMTMHVQNVGEKTISGQEYCHNFLTIDGMAIGPDYRVRMPHLADQGQASVQGGFVCADGRGFRFDRYCPEKETIQISLDGCKQAETFPWELSNQAAGAKVNGSDRLDLCHSQMFTADHMVAPATYQRLVLKPGEESRWVRTYCFSTL